MARARRRDFVNTLTKDSGRTCQPSIRSIRHYLSPNQDSGGWQRGRETVIGSVPSLEYERGHVRPEEP